MKFICSFLAMALSCVCVNFCYSQQKPSFQIVEKGTVKDIAAFETVLNKADFDKYRLTDKKRLLEFEDGAKVSLLSWDEMESSFGKKASGHFEVIKESEIVFPNKFVISPTGYIIEKVPVITK